MRESELILVSLTAFFVALVAGLIFSAFFKKFKVPWAVALILAGIVLGPYGLKLFELNEVILFLSEVGVIFLMFLAGMETRLSSIKAVWKESTFIGIFAGLMPGLVGFGVGILFGYDIIVSILLGIILINSSFAVVVPALESKGMLHTRIGKIIVASTMFQDISSLIAFALLLQFITPGEFLPFPLWIILFVAVIAGIVIKMFMPKLKKLFSLFDAEERKNGSIFEGELRLVMVIVLGAAIIFEFLKFETIVGAFFAGLLISELVKSKILEAKLHVLGYGVFIPIFFVTVGAWADITLFLESQIWPLIAAIVFGSMIAKFLGGLIASKLIGLTNYEGILVGLTSTPQLITTLALAVVSQRLNLLPTEIVTSIIILAIVSVVIAPIVTNKALDAAPKQK